MVVVVVMVGVGRVEESKLEGGRVGCWLGASEAVTVRTALVVSPSSVVEVLDEMAAWAALVAAPVRRSGIAVVVSTRCAPQRLPLACRSCSCSIDCHPAEE